LIFELIVCKVILGAIDMLSEKAEISLEEFLFLFILIFYLSFLDLMILKLLMKHNLIIVTLLNQFIIGLLELIHLNQVLS
jgi:hypothetical protein